MVSKVISIGNKVDIRVVSEIENAEHTGIIPHIYKSQILDFFDNGEVELSMPSERGKIILLHLGLRYEFVFYTNTGLYRCYGQIKERYKTDNQYMLRVVFNTQLSKFQRREYYRLSCILDTSYFEISNEMAMMENTNEIEEMLQSEIGYSEKEKKGFILDISGGGVRFVSSEQLEADSYILMYVCLGNDSDALEYPIVGHVLRSSRIENAVQENYEHRVEFILKDSKVRESIIRYIFLEERKSRKNGKG